MLEGHVKPFKHINSQFPIQPANITITNAAILYCIDIVLNFKKN